MRIDYSRSAGKYISALDVKTKKRIKEGIEGLTKSPPKGDIKPVRMYSKGTMRLRIGKYRIIYRYAFDADKQQMLYISDIDSRGEIYKG